MNTIAKTEWLILNATADDYEDLEQIYRAVCLEFSSDNYNPSDPNAFYLRKSCDWVPFAELVETLISLVKRGLISVAIPNSNGPPDLERDFSYVWRGYFNITAEGRELLKSSESRK